MEELNKQKIKSRNKLIVERGPVQIKIQENKWKRESRKQNLEVDPEGTRNEERKRKGLSMKRQRQNDPEKFKEDQRKRQMKSKLIDSEMKRLKKFKERTMLNAIFT